MKHSTGLTRRGGLTWWLLPIATAALTVLGCEPSRTNAPLILNPAPAPAAKDISVSDGNIPCFANSRACGEFGAKIDGPFINDYVNITPGHMGAWTRTWSPTNEAGYMSAAGTVTIQRGTGGGFREVKVNLANSEYGTQTGDGYVTTTTCASERNAILGSSRNAAQGPNLMAWFGAFSDVKTCDGPAGDELSCDENGTPVDQGGDPANCPGDDSGTGGETQGSGIQFQPGDYTSGETVDWATGVGDGGDSVCGQAAQVDYVCIDTWNDETQSWQAYGCGYATTC